MFFAHSRLPAAGDFLRRTDAGHHVFALGVEEVFAVEVLVLARGGIAGERHARAAAFAHIAEDHGLHVDRRAQQAADVVERAVLVGARVVPRAEHRVDALPELIHGIGREVFLRVLLVQLFVEVHDLLEHVGVELGVEFLLVLGLHLVEGHFKVMMRHAQ